MCRGGNLSVKGEHAGCSGSARLQAMQAPPPATPDHASNFMLKPMRWWEASTCITLTLTA